MAQPRYKNKAEWRRKNGKPDMRPPIEQPSRLRGMQPAAAADFLTRFAEERVTSHDIGWRGFLSFPNERGQKQYAALEVLRALPASPAKKLPGRKGALRTERPSAWWALLSKPQQETIAGIAADSWWRSLSDRKRAEQVCHWGCRCLCPAADQGGE